MKLLLKRKFKGETYTVGDLFIDGEFFCNTLEDKVRILPLLCPDTPQGIPCRCKEKKYAETAIPYGTYRITMQYSPKFKRVLPYLHDVPHFLGILVHNGSNIDHSAGCVLIGRNTIKGGLTESKKTLDELIDRIGDCRTIEITIYGKPHVMQSRILCSKLLICQPNNCNYDLT